MFPEELKAKKKNNKMNIFLSVLSATPHRNGSDNNECFNFSTERQVSHLALKIPAVTVQRGSIPLRKAFEVPGLTTCIFVAEIMLYYYAC